MKKGAFHIRDEEFINAMLQPIGKMIAACVESTANRVLDNYIKTKGDSISKSQAEREFGKAWLRDHIKVYGHALYTQGVWNPETGALNNKQTFSRKQLSEIRAKETTTESLIEFSAIIYKFQREEKKNGKHTHTND